MNIIETSIPDVTIENLNQNKVVIADNIIKNVYPLFDEVYQAKLERVIELRNDVKGGKMKMKTEKDTMEKLMNSYKKEKQITKILERVKKLISAGLTYDPSLKHETVILLKILDKLPREKLDQQFSKVSQLLSKRFSR
jgi:predicted ribonuclease YlaK